MPDSVGSIDKEWLDGGSLNGSVPTHDSPPDPVGSMPESDSMPTGDEAGETDGKPRPNCVYVNEASIFPSSNNCSHHIIIPPLFPRAGGRAFIYTLPIPDTGTVSAFVPLGSEECYRWVE